jgi:branched-chain amino acid transport system permease protein
VNPGSNTRAVLVFAIGAAALALLPALGSASMVDKATTLLIYLLLAVSWNLMAGYAGLVSVGQQAFFGLGAYFALRLVDAGLGAYPALLAGACGAAVVAWVLSFFVLRLEGGEFAIATWVIAEVIRILVMLDPLVQGETGTSLIALNALDPPLRRNLAYALALVSLIAATLAFWWLLRSPAGRAAQAIGDDAEAAASLGVRVLRTRQLIYVAAAFGAALAGVAWLASAITFLPRTNFGVQWSVLMLFMVLVGGLRSFEGPFIGALLLFALQEWLGDFGAWYLAGLGAVAIGFALGLPQGLWGALQQRRGWRLVSTAAHPPADAALSPHLSLPRRQLP